MAAARDHLPPERVAGSIALLSVCAAAGIGAGYPISGLIVDGLGLSAAFWFGALVSALALLSVVAVVPSSADRPAAALDVTGAVLLTAGLVALLLAIGEGTAWGWTSARTLGLFAGRRGGARRLGGPAAAAPARRWWSCACCATRPSSR